MKFTKAISLIVVFALLTVCFHTSVLAKIINNDNDVSNTVVLCGQQLSSIREKYTLMTDVSKKSYLKEVFCYFGIKSTTVDYLSYSTINCLVNSEEFGFQTIIYSDQINFRSMYSENREFDHMTLSVLWGRTGTTYTITGFQEWTDLPIMRLKDIISLDLGGGSIVNGSQGAVLLYNKNGTTYMDEYDKDDPEYKGVQSACVFEIDLPNSADEMGFIITYSIVKNSTDNTITMQYFHKWTPWIFSIGISYIGGISISPSSIYTEYPLQAGTAV